MMPYQFTLSSPAQRWRLRAEELRVTAEGMHPTNAATLFDIAAQWEQLANDLEFVHDEKGGFPLRSM